MGEALEARRERSSYQTESEKMSPVSTSAMRGFGVRKAGLGASVRARTACAASTNRVLEQSSKQLPTVEQQRVAARQMIAYFKEKKVEAEYEKNKQLGWVPKAEIANGRWVMFW